MSSLLRRSTCVLLIGWLVSVGDAYAQTVAAEADSPSPFEKLRVRFEDSVERLNDRGLYPEAGSIVSGSGLALGLGVRRLKIFGDRPVRGEIEGMWSVRGYQQYQLNVGLVDHARTTLQLKPADATLTSLFNEQHDKAPGSAIYASVTYRRSPRVDFFGVGPIQEELETDFAINGMSVDGVAQWQPTSVFGLAMRVGLLDLSIGRGTDSATPDLQDRFTPAEAPGLAAQPRYVTAGIGAAIDTRDSQKLPTRGSFLGVAAWRFVPVGANGDSFGRFGLDFRMYHGLLARAPDRHVLAARLLVAVDETPVPFYLQHWLGGSHTLRGYESYRFRGENLFHFSVEHRWRAAKFIEVAPFIDAGLVARTVEGVHSSPLEITPGVGLRLRTDEQCFFRLDWGHGRAGNRFLFSFSPAF